MMKIWKTLSLVFVVVAVILTVFFASRVFETNQSENYQVKQAAISGDLSVRSAPGFYMQNFGSITTYRIADDYHFKIPKVLFRDGSSADITGTVRYRLPVGIDERIFLHREMKSYMNVKDALVTNAVAGALSQTAKLFGAEEVYSTESSRFIEIFMGQLNDGIYKTIRAGQINKVARNEDGSPRIAKTSILSQYGIDVTNIEISNLDFDAKTDELIASRKDAEQQETLARAEAERAKQDAITSEERGKANVAKVKYEALAIKETAVIEAEKKTAIENEKTLQALEIAKQEKAKGEAEAYAAKLKVAAGLSPREQAEIDKETAIGVAKAMAGVKFPQTMVLTTGDGGGKHQALNPFDAVGLKAFQDMAKSNAPSKKK